MSKFNSIKDQRLVEVVEFFLVFGEEQACDNFNLKSDTVRRYALEYQKRFGKEINVKKDLLQIQNIYSDSEIRAIAKGGRVLAGMNKVPSLDFTGKHLKIAVFSDTHIGSKFTYDEHIMKVIETINSEGVDFAFHAGDMTEGMSGRGGHTYELSHIGYKAQRDHFVELFQHLKVKTFAISGNHDRWYISRSDIGACICSDICDKLLNFEFVGHDTGFINIGGITVQLWHGIDGASYAKSYRPQKIVESLSGGAKPNLLLLGHDHKVGYNFIRNIHVVSSGCVQLQTDYMRGKRLGADTGFWILELTVNDGTISRFKSEFLPFYC